MSQELSYAMISLEIPIKTVSEANSREHWHVKARRHHDQKKLIGLILNAHINPKRLPCHIKLCRIAQRKLDYDNLVSSQKYVLDAICELLIPGLAPGRADGDPRITVSYEQETRKGPLYAVRIEIIHTPP